MKFAVTSRQARPARLFGLALGVALAAGGALAAWAATGDVALRRPAGMAGTMLPRGPMLDRLLDEAGVSPTQRAQAHQIFDAAEAELKQGRVAEQADHEQMAQLFSQAVVDPAAVETVRERIQSRHDGASRRATQALLDVSLVLSADQREAIARQLADGPRPFRPHHPHPASAAND
jgi:Spy/CpxP family protein refolding chaperone